MRPPGRQHAGDDPDKELAEQIDEKTARKFTFIPFSEEGGKIVVWGADVSPAKRAAAEQAAGKQFEWYATDPKTVHVAHGADVALRRRHRPARRRVPRDRRRSARPAEEAVNQVSLDDQAPVVQLVSRIVGQALRDRASDIHIEPLDKDVRVRYRIDGQLVEAVRLPTAPTTRWCRASRSCRR